eukprot:COSAG02_NODE_7504_length_2982_cov_3.081512_1_plen_63_part_00
MGLRHGDAEVQAYAAARATHIPCGRTHSAERAEPAAADQSSHLCVALGLPSLSEKTPPDSGG